MKKIMLLSAFVIAGFVNAKNVETKKTEKLAEKSEVNKKKKYTFNGFIAYDTECCGTCFQYGTYTEFDYGNGVVLWEFQAASQATSSTVITPECTGSGSYLG